MEMSITRAMKEFKLLDSRIDKSIRELKLVDFTNNKHKGMALRSQLPVEEFEKSQLALYQKVTDLIDYRNKMKGAIVISNATTTVVVAGVEMTVAQAIEEKRFISMRKALLSRMKVQNNGLNEEIAKATTNLDSQLDSLVMANTGKDKRIDKDDYNKIADPFILANKLVKLDPLKLDGKIVALEEYIDTFINDVDIVLSESNSKTMINV